MQNALHRHRHSHPVRACGCRSSTAWNGLQIDKVHRDPITQQGTHGGEKAEPQGRWGSTLLTIQGQASARNMRLRPAPCPLSVLFGYRQPQASQGSGLVWSLQQWVLEGGVWSCAHPSWPVWRGFEAPGQVLAQAGQGRQHDYSCSSSPAPHR